MLVPSSGVGVLLGVGGSRESLEDGNISLGRALTVWNWLVQSSKTGIRVAQGTLENPPNEG